MLAPDAPVDPLVERLFGYADAGATGGAYRLVDDLLEAGWSLERVVTDLLGGVQQYAGGVWRSGEMTIAREHAVTAVVDDLLGAMGRLVPAPSAHATVALVCAEGEWHVTPARMMSLLLRQHGWRVAFFGASTPTDHLRRSLELTRPSFLAISCTNPLALFGAARVAAASARLGIPTLAGGAAFGSDGRRAARLGIDGWASDPAAASSLLHRWLDAPPSRRSAPSEIESDVPALERCWSSIVEQALGRLSSEASPTLRHGARPLAHVRRDLHDLLRVAYLGAVCDDPSLVTCFVEELREGHPVAGLPREAVLPSVRLLHELSAPLAEPLHTGLSFALPARHG